MNRGGFAPRGRNDSGGGFAPRGRNGSAGGFESSSGFAPSGRNNYGGRFEPSGGFEPRGRNDSGGGFERSGGFAPRGRNGSAGGFESSSGFQHGGGYAPRGRFEPSGGFAPRQRGSNFNASGNNFASRSQQQQAPVEPAGNVVPFSQCLNANIDVASDNLLINSYALTLPNVPVYQYELKFFADYGREDKAIEDLSETLTKSVLASNRRACVTQLYDNLLNQHVAFFESNKYKGKSFHHVYAYDRSSIFFCSLIMPSRDESNPFVIDITKMTANMFGHLRKPKRVYATLKQGHYLNPHEPFDAEMMSTFLEVLFSQHQHDGYNQYVKFGSKIYDLNTKHEIGNGCELKDGHQKSVRVHENAAEIQIDAKISPFHQALSLYDYIEKRWGFGEQHDFCTGLVNSQLQELKGLFVKTIHKQNVEIFRIHGITKVGADKLTFDNREGGKTSVADYFARLYGQISYPKYPCAIKKVGPKEMHYPLECLEVHNGQKFPKDIMNGTQEQQMIKNAQRLPLDLMEEIKLQKQQASVHDHDQYVFSTGVKVAEHMNSVTAEILSAPLITYKNENMPKQVVDAVWDIKDVEFVKPATINALAILYNNVPQAVVRLSVKRILDQAKRLGMTIVNHDFLELHNTQLTFEFLEKTILDYRDNYGVDFVLAIAGGSEFHNILKATEVSTKVATQQVEPRTISNPKLGGVTIGNILQKMNPKNGGYNQYFQQAAPSQVNGDRIDVFQSFLQTTMVMGLYMSHPSPGSNEELPSVCGYSFSTNKRGNVARGGFVFTKARQSILSAADLRKPFEDATKLYFQENKCYPERVLVYRFGTSDGEIIKIQGDECQAMLECLTAGMNGELPKLTVIVVRRQHNTRIFKQKNAINPRDRPPAQNVTPGSCVAGATPVDFVMVPHRALQGTAKPTIFSTIFPTADENDLSQNFLENITHAFCYMHEIVDSPISVPHTLRSAEQMANRGTKLWHSKSYQFPPLSPEELLSHATNALNPLINTRYWA